MIVALVSHYLTNKLIIRRPFPKRRSFTPKSTCGIRHHFWCLSLTLGYVPTRYSAVRRSCTSEEALPLDLHVLGTPPAFILSQDQTLQKKNLLLKTIQNELTLICTIKLLKIRLSRDTQIVTSQKTYYYIVSELTEPIVNR